MEYYTLFNIFLAVSIFVSLTAMDSCTGERSQKKETLRFT